MEMIVNVSCVRAAGMHPSPSSQSEDWGESWGMKHDPS